MKDATKNKTCNINADITINHRCTTFEKPFLLSNHMPTKDSTHIRNTAIVLIKDCLGNYLRINSENERQVVSEDMNQFKNEINHEFKETKQQKEYIFNDYFQWEIEISSSKKDVKQLRMKLKSMKTGKYLQIYSTVDDNKHQILVCGTFNDFLSVFNIHPSSHSLFAMKLESNHFTNEFIGVDKNGIKIDINGSPFSRLIFYESGIVMDDEKNDHFINLQNMSAFDSHSMTNKIESEFKTFDDLTDDELYNPLYVHNHWLRYQRLTLHWPMCDGSCGSKFNRMIFNMIYGQSKKINRAHKSNTKPSANDYSSVDSFYNGYQISKQDTEGINFFASMNPTSMKTDAVVQMWSLMDNLRGRINEHMQAMNAIESETIAQQLISQDIENTLNIREIISKHFLCYSTPVRRFCISILDSFDSDTKRFLNENIAQYRHFLETLKNKNNIICDETQTFSIYSHLTAIKDKSHYFLLFQLSKIACIHQTHTLFQEFKNNGFFTISPHIYVQDIIRVMHTKEYQTMKDHGQELTAEEIIAILVYTGADQISKSIRMSYFQQQRNCRWNHFNQHLISAVDKMHKILVQSKTLVELPSKLYYAMHNCTDHGLNEKKEKKNGRYYDMISVTSSIAIASRFMIGNGSTIIIFHESNLMLHTSRFVAAPLYWISRNPNEEEWLLTGVKIHVAMEKINEDGNLAINCYDYETISHQSMNIWRKLLYLYLYFIHISLCFVRIADASMILNCNNDQLMSTMKSVCTNQQMAKCDHCGCQSPIYWFQGSILMNNMECAFCRRYNLFVYNNDDRIVSCFGCREQSKLKLFVVEHNSQLGCKCPKCGKYQSQLFPQSMEYSKMNYLKIRKIGYDYHSNIIENGCEIKPKEEEKEYEELMNGTVIVQPKCVQLGGIQAVGIQDFDGIKKKKNRFLQFRKKMRKFKIFNIMIEDDQID